jgi:hypothetical protein
LTAFAQITPSLSRALVTERLPATGWFARVAALLWNLGPYAVIELLLPGGSLIALLLWLYRRHRGDRLTAPRPGVSRSPTRAGLACLRHHTRHGNMTLPIPSN